ncbi:sensor histidine kinase [Nioella aestuarii]|uniref:sensor histidine kinase n=1 Tax=Nioella aestuarii TaxID=1662864 RepID=UPI003D7FFC74
MPPVMEVDPAYSSPNIAPAMRFARDVGQPIADIVTAYMDGALSGDFEAVTAPAAPYQPIWALTELLNIAPDEGRPPDAWILASDTHGLVALDVFLVRDGGATEQLLAHDIRESFDPSDFSATRLSSAPVELAAGERALLMVRMTYGATDLVDLSLETPADHQARTFTDGLTLAGFYAFLASCILFFAVFSATMRSDVGGAYAGLLALGLIFIAYIDILLFRFLYPTHPTWHLPVGLSLLYALCAAGFATAALSLTRFATKPKLKRAFQGLAVVSIIAIALVFILPPEIMAPVSYILLVLMLGSHLVAGFHWDMITGARRPVFRVVVLVAFVGLGLLILLALARLGSVEIPMNWAIKAIYAIIAFGTMSGLSVGLIDMRREHAAALEREMVALQKEAETTRELLEAERNYSHARDLADRRRQQLATMSHDIRQPLASLRMTMETMTRDQSPEIRERLSEAFDYMHDLALGHLEDSRPEDDLPGDPPPPEPEDATDPYALSLILNTVAQMFREEAVSKGLRLRVVPSSLGVTVPPLILMRIVSNLVSNAVKYTTEGTVLAGVRRLQDGARVDVLDTGVGMTAEELESFRQAWSSGETSTGHGLGLSICHELAAQHGLDLSVTSSPGKGTVFSLRFPAGRVVKEAS